MLLIQLNSKRSEMPYVGTQPRPPAPLSQVIVSQPIFDFDLAAALRTSYVC
jgi:hypothetical protein